MSGSALIPESDAARLARLETQFGQLAADMREMRSEQRQHADTIARAIGGVKVLGMLGAVGGLLTLGRALLGWLAATQGGR